jgi:ribosome-associated protein
MRQPSFMARAGRAKICTMSARDDGTPSARQIARKKQRRAGDRSTRLANALMKLSAPALKKLALDEDLRDAVDRARAVTQHIARRRAERTLAGELRRFDLVELDAQLAKAHESGNTDVQQLHIAEQWRARMIEEGVGAAASFPGGASEPLSRLIDAAKRERATGRPPGAARALFRHIVEVLKAQRPDAEANADADADADAEADGDGDA